MCFCSHSENPGNQYGRKKDVNEYPDFHHIPENGTEDKHEQDGYKKKQESALGYGQDQGISNFMGHACPPSSPAGSIALWIRPWFRKMVLDSFVWV
jgi:hypothetical protein